MKTSPGRGIGRRWWIPATVNGATVTFDVTDGGSGDSDLTADGVITDPGGPGQTAEPVPALPVAVWWVLLLAMLAATASMLGRFNGSPGARAIS